MALTALRKLYGWEETKTRQKGESREQQLELILRYRREHCAPLMDSVDEIMLALAEKYAIEKNERWSLAREGSAICKAVIFWLNNRKELRSFLHDPRICPDNNQRQSRGRLSQRCLLQRWDEGTKNGPDRSALLGHNFVY